MKVLIAVSCLLAYASAGLLGLSHTAYTYPHLSLGYSSLQHLPVIGPNGVPVDEPAVQVARAEHAAAHVEAAARNGDAIVVGGQIAAEPVVYAAGHGVWAGPQHLPVIGANGVPVDEPAVQVARANHAASHIEAKVRNGDAAIVAHSIASPILAHSAPVLAHSIIAHPNGAVVPADTPEVVAARSAHLQAHLEEKARHGLLPLVHYRKRRGILAYGAPLLATHYAGPQHLPVIGANGVPVDEPAVQIARANHAAAVVEAEVRNGDAAVVVQSAPLVAAHTVYGGPQHLPVIGANGVPVDEAAVQIARANHAAHHIEAKVRNGDAAIVAHSIAAPLVAHHVATPVVAHANGAVVPADTIEVAAAKAQHYAAHIEAKARNGDLPLVYAY